MHKLETQNRIGVSIFFKKRASNLIIGTAIHAMVVANREMNNTSAPRPCSITAAAASAPVSQRREAPPRSSRAGSSPLRGPAASGQRSGSSPRTVGSSQSAACHADPHEAQEAVRGRRAVPRALLQGAHRPAWVVRVTSWGCRRRTAPCGGRRSAPQGRRRWRSRRESTRRTRRPRAGQRARPRRRR